MRPVSKADIKKFVRDTVKEMKSEITNHNDWHDRGFEEVDNWWGVNIGGGSIDALGDYPDNDRDMDMLMAAVTILQTAEQEGWGVADDTGLWEGMSGWQAVLSQAFFTLEQAIGQQEPRDLV